MSRTLVVMRHAKSSWGDPSLSDFDRPLNKRGERDAPEMGRRLKSEGYQCELMIVSPAVRARMTAERVAEQIGYSPEAIVFDQRLYMADIANYLDVIAGVDESVNHLLIVSHNPGSEALITHLSGEAFEKFPTAAYALLEVEGSWKAMGTVHFIDFDFPKSSA